MPFFEGQSIAALGAGLRAGHFTASDVAADTLERIAGRNPELHAFVAVTAERATAEASRADRELQAGTDRGPLHGIPYAVKDLFDVTGVATTAQSRVLANNIASSDAVAVQRLSEAGAVLVGKLATYEHAIEPWPSDDGLFPPARNPRDAARVTGGSSSGSAAAVGAGLLRFALGTDSGGSVRSPAGYCGVVGLKPSYGAVSCDGVLPLSPSLDHVGPLAATVEEAALVFRAIAGRAAAVDGVDLDRGLEDLTVGYARRFFADDAPHEFLLALDAAADRIAELGAEIVEVELPPYSLFEDCGRVILQSEAYAQHAATLRARPDLYGSRAFGSLMAGAVLSASDLVVAQQVQRTLTEAVDRQVLAQCDTMLTANVLATAPRLDQLDAPGRRWRPMRTFPFNVTGHPALAMPMGIAADGMPMGLQLVAAKRNEALLCRLGIALERALRDPVTRQAELRMRAS